MGCHRAQSLVFIIFVNAIENGVDSGVWKSVDDIKTSGLLKVDKTPLRKLKGYLSI